MKSSFFLCSSAAARNLASLDRSILSNSDLMSSSDGTLLLLVMLLSFAKLFLVASYGVNPLNLESYALED